MKKTLEPVVLERSDDKGIVLTGDGIEKVKAIEVEYYNEANDRSVYNMVSPNFREKLTRENVQALLLKDEWELKAEVSPTPTINRLRISFWREFDRAQSKSTGMKMVKIYAGICPREQFMELLKNDNHVAWILKPPVDYVNAMEEALTYGIDRMREILEVPIIQTRHIKLRQADGSDELETYEEFDPKTADLLIKTVAMLDMRVKGALVQKVEQKVLSENRNVNATLNVNATQNLPEDQLAQIGINNIDEEIKRLESEIKDDVGKIQESYSKRELNAIAKKGVKVDDIVEVVDTEEDVGEKQSANIPPKVTEAESSDDPVENSTLFDDDEDLVL